MAGLHPGSSSSNRAPSRGRERANLDSLRYLSPTKFFYFELVGNNQNKSHIVGTIPKTSIIFGSLFLRVVERFDAILPTMFLGVSSDDESIGEAPLSSKGVREVYTGGFDDYGKQFTQDTIIVISMKVTGGTISTGFAQGLIPYIELNRIPSFRKVTGLS